MNMHQVMSVLTRSVEVVLLVSFPFLAAALVTGVTISLLQSVTQIQEQTLTFVPKLLMVILVFLLTLPWALDVLGVFMSDLYLMFPTIRP